MKRLRVAASSPWARVRSDPMVPFGPDVPDWRDRLPVLQSGTVALRELQPSDARPLLALINTSDVARYLSPPPATVEGFENFIAWTHRQRAAGAQAACAVVVQGFDI